MSDTPPRTPSPEPSGVEELTGGRSAEEGVPFDIPTPLAATPSRPSVLTTAAFVLCAFALLNGVLAALGFWQQGSGPSRLLSDAGAQLTTTVAAERLVIGILQLLAALFILRLKGIGRVLGLILAVVETIEGFVAVIDGRGTAVLAIGVNLFLVYALATTGDVFARARRG